MSSSVQQLVEPRSQVPTAGRASEFILASVIGLGTAAVYTAFSLRQWTRFESPSWDLGIFTQLAKAYSTLSAPIVPIKGDQFNLLGDHFHPLLVLLGPIYAAFPSGLTLLVVQNVLFGLTVAIVTHAAIRRIGTPAGASIGIALGLSWGLQTAVESQFHEIAFAMPLLAIALWSFLSGRWTAAALWAAPMVFVKEDLGVTVAVFGILIALRARWPGGVWLAVWGILWTLLSVVVILPAMNASGSYAYGFGGGGSDPASFFSGLFAFEKFETLALLALICVGLAVWSPLALLALPTLAWRMLSGNENYWGTAWHYSAILMPVIFAAAVDGVTRLREHRRVWLRTYARLAPFVALVVAVLLIPAFPLRALSDVPPFEPSSREAATRQVLSLIPEGSSVETDITLMAYLVPDNTVFWWGNLDNPPPDYIALDTRSGSWSEDFQRASASAFAERQYPGVAYADIYLSDGYQVAKRLR